MPEEFALQQRFVERRAVDLDEGLVPARPGIVDGLGHQFLARPAFVVDDFMLVLL